jgi:glutamate racemase
MIIGICDYGIGGISLYKRLRELSDVDVIYYSDTGYVPYGKVPEDELRTQVRSVTDFLFEQGADHIAVACNAASTVLPVHPKIIGIIDHGLEVVRSAGTKSVGVVGGYRTILSNVYKTPLENEGMIVLQNVAQQLSIRIEAGDLHSPEMLSDVQTIFEPLSQCEAILLACTHYPAIADTIKTIVPDSQLLDPMENMVNYIHRNWPSLEGTKNERWITSGDTEKMKQAADKAFGVQLSTIEQIIV